MKNIIFITLLFSSVIAKAQFEKGDKYLGGSVGLGFTTSAYEEKSYLQTGSANNFVISVNPQFFKAANANTLHGFVIGLGFSTSNSDNKNQGITYLKGVSSGFNASVGYAIRKYKPLSEKLFWYMEYSGNIEYGYSWANSTNNNSNSTKTDGMGYSAYINVLPALAFKVDDRMLIDVNFGGLNTGYNYSSTEGTHSKNFNFNLNLSSRISLGVLLKLKNTKH